MQYAGTTALVTGASSGLGAEFARRLAQRGADLVLVARRRDLLEALAVDIRDTTGRTVQVVGADLSHPGSGTLLADAVADLGVSVDTLINNAGFGKTATFAQSSRDDVQAQLGLNVTAVVDITQSFLPQLLASDKGALVNVASLIAYLPMPNMAVYAASKAFVLHFTEALAYELRGSSLSVMALSPGPTRTGFYAASGTSDVGVAFQEPAEVVATALTALDRRLPPLSIVSGPQNRWRSRLAGVLPRRALLRMVSGPAPLARSGGPSTY